ncbi:MAG: IS66 family transposase [Actinomycetota bacterium]|nr:IS66 family transposase [Actinomycetota bacterium]
MIAEQEEAIGELRLDVVAQAGDVGELREQNAELVRRVARLERLISRNSGNSSMPPSGDDQPGRTPPEPELKPKRDRTGKRKPGGQPGAKGSHLAWNDDPDDTVDHFPGGTCACGASLAGAADLGVAVSHQQIDIPLAAATVTQHDLHEVACGCGRVHRAATPAGTGGAGTVTYGLNLRAWCIYLMAAHAIPVHRCAELIESLTGARPSPGFVHSLLARAAAAVAGANKLIRCLIILARVVSADETPVRVGPGPKSRKRYLLVACTNLLTYYYLGDRSLKTFAAFVLPDLSGVVVHDRYQNYDSFPGLTHQLCTAHLLRDLADAAQTYPDAHWPVQVRQALQGLIHAANQARAEGLPAIPAQIAGPLTHAFTHGVILGLGQVKKVAGRKQQPCRDLLECLRDRQDDVLRFVSDLRIPPTSNQAERDVRPARTQQKISGRLRSEDTTRHRYAIRSYISTTAKHGENVVTAIRDALAGNPWMPPVPDPP